MKRMRMFLALTLFIFLFTHTSPSLAQTEWVNIYGTVTFDDTPLIAMVLANGQYMFTEGANLGTFDLEVPLDENGEITLYGFCEGFAPFKTVLEPEEALDFDIHMIRAAAGSKDIDITMQTEPGTDNPDYVRISGTVHDDGTPLCAMVLANGQSMFSCDANLGTFDLEVPLDEKEEITLYGFCEGFAPYKETTSGNDLGGQEPDEPEEFNLDDVVDTYYSVISTPENWGFYNVHDPSVMKADNGYWYAYSTDASYGNIHEPGIQVRRSLDLVEWEYLGSAFDGVPEQGAAFITANGGTPFDGLWAPCVLKHGDEYRLYYALGSPTPRLSTIGLVTADSPEGPWTERGLVVQSYDNAEQHTNAIDPSVVETPNGEYWMVYGSSWDGIWVLQLDPETGLALVDGDRGHRIAHRGFTNGIMNGNIEGAEIIWNAEFQQYYLFIAYDWVITKYNIRVARGDQPWGPFYDFHNTEINLYSDNVPMIVAPYKWSDHTGWQGTAHNATFYDENTGQWFIAHQGRPTADPGMIVMHVRRLHWTSDGWPIASPERYAGVEQSEIMAEDLVGSWDQIVLGYQVVPGFEETQTSPDLQVAFSLTISADQTLNGDAGSTWHYQAPWLTMTWSNGFIDIVRVERERDWEAKVASTLVFTGLNNNGTTIWGKKLLD